MNSQVNNQLKFAEPCCSPSWPTSRPSPRCWPCARGDAFARAHGRAALRFHLSLAVYLAAIIGLHARRPRGIVVAVQLVPFLLFLNLMLVLNWLLFAAVGDPPRRDRAGVHLPHDHRKDLMPKIAFVGAGSTVFTRNLVGDVLEPAGAARRHDVRADGHRRRAPADGRDRRRAADRRARRAGARSRRRPDRRAALDGADYVVTSFQVGGYKPVDGGRLRGAQALRAAPDDRRHARRRRHHARAAHDPGAARRLPRHGGALPGRAAAQLRQPDGDALLGGGRGELDPHRRPLPLRPAHGRRAGRTTSGCPPPSSTTTSPASTTWRSSCGSSTRARTSTRRCASVDAARTRTASATSCCEHFGYFVTESTEHFAEYVPWFIKDGRDGPDRALQHPARRVPAPLRAPDRELGGRCAASSKAAARSTPSAATSTAPTSSARARPASRSRSTATSRTAGRTAADRQPAGRLLRRGAVRRVDRTGSSRSRSARSRATSPR